MLTANGFKNRKPVYAVNRLRLHVSVLRNAREAAVGTSGADAAGGGMIRSGRIDGEAAVESEIRRDVPAADDFVFSSGIS